MKDPKQIELDKECKYIIAFAETSGYKVDISPNPRLTKYKVAFPDICITIVRHSHNGDFNYSFRDVRKSKRVFSFMHSIISKNEEKILEMEEYIEQYF